VSVIYWDTMVFIYLFEEHPRFSARVREIRSNIGKRGDRLCTGTLTVGEVLTGPYVSGDSDLAAKYKSVFRPPVVDIIDFDMVAADHFARIRCDRTIGRPDAMQLACAAAANVDLFLTNDHRLQGKVIPGIQFIGGLDVNVL